jgi:hypothetical protein
VGIGDLSKPSVGEERSGSGGSARLEYPVPSNKGQIIRACRFKAGQARDGGLWRSHKLSADNIVNLLKRDWSMCPRRHMDQDFFLTFGLDGFAGILVGVGEVVFPIRFST